MKKFKCKYCQKEFSLEEKQAGDTIHCPNCKKHLYTVALAQANKYSEQKPYHRDKPEG
jgi:Zn finger protein HypA/HybF involved in hydrogenase expression